MSQNAPLTTQEIDGRKRQAEVARSINGADKGKGKGKEKATAAVMELSSDEDGDDGVVLAHAHRDEDPNDPIVDDDDRRTANGRQGSHRRYSESYASASRTPSKKKGRQSFHVGDRFDESQEASSPDPIGMTGPSKERAHVGQLQASSEIVDKVLAGRKGQVSALVQQFDKPKASLAQSMQGKRVRSLAGKNLADRADAVSCYAAPARPRWRTDGRRRDGRAKTRQEAAAGLSTGSS